jgi:predicted aspartyl protease
MVVPDGLGISLLGQSFLQKVGRVEMESDRMVLGG